MGHGTKFKLSNMFPSVLSKIKGMTGKRVKGKGDLTNPSDWSDDLQDFSTASKDSPGSPPSPVRTFPQNRDRDMRYCSSPRCSSPVNHRSYDIRFPSESPVRRGMKSRPVSPPRRSANSTDSGCCSFDSTLALVPQDRVRRAVPQLFGRCLQRSKCNSYNSDTHSDSELDITDSEPQSARAHLRARTMSLQLDGTLEWERERERERDWSEPEKTASSTRRRRGLRDPTSKTSTAGEPSPIHTVRCMPPNTPSEAGNYSEDPRDMDHRSACPDFSREMSADQNHHSNVTLRFDRKLSFTADDNRLFEDTYTSFSSDEDFFKVRSGQNAIGQYRLKKVNKYGHGDVTSAAAYTSSEVILTEDEQRGLRREAVLAKAVRSSAASDGWARVQSRFAEEEKHATTRGGRVSYDRKSATDEPDAVLVMEDERGHGRSQASVVKKAMSAKDWARENLRALSKASELEKQAKQLRATASLVEYESFGLPVIQKEQYLHSRVSSRTHSSVGEVEKHTKGRIDYKSSPNDDHHDYGSDNLVYEQFSQPLAEYASEFYRNAHSEEFDFEPNVASRPWEVEFPSFRSDRGSRRSAPVEFSEPEGPTPRNHRISVQERSARTPRKQTPTTASSTPREALNRKSTRSASPKVHDGPVNSMKPPSTRPRSPRRQELHSGKRATSPRTPSSTRHEVVSKKMSGRSQSPRRQQEASGKKPSSNSLPSGQQQQDASSKKANARSVSPAAARKEPDSEKKNGGTNARGISQARPQLLQQEERTSVMGSDSVAVVKASYDPYQDFRESMVEMILEKDIQTAEDLEELLQCYLSLNSAEYHLIIVQVFSDIWRDIFDH